jgi:hypothetical protein
VNLAVCTATPTAGRCAVAKLKEKSAREMRDLGLTVEKDGNGSAKVSDKSTTPVKG